MKYLSVYMAIFIASAISAQQKDSTIATAIQAHIFKPKTVKATEERVQQLKLPDGFQIATFASNLGKPRIMAVGPKGEVFVTRRSGEVILLKDTDKDGTADEQKTVITKEGAHGLAVYKGKLYLITVNDVYRGKINGDGSIGKLERIIENLPDGGQHPNRTLAFGPDGNMYVSVGSDCNACDETREESATILQFDENGKNKKIFARGLRNTIGFDWEPSTQQLYGLDHGIDWLGDEEQMEELNLLTEGGNYGWPYIYGPGKYNLADQPEDMDWKSYAEKCIDPVMGFTAHSAPMDLKFYTGTMFPETYGRGAFVTFHGSWNRKEPKGYKIMHIAFDNGKAVAQEDFLTGFLTDGGQSYFGRPVDLVQLPDGSLLMSDDGNGAVYRIYYER